MNLNNRGEELTPIPGLESGNPYLVAEPVQMKLILGVVMHPPEQYSQLSHEFTFSLNFYPPGNEPQFELDGPGKELDQYSEYWASVSSSSLRDLVNFLDWLNSHKRFLKAAQAFCGSFGDSGHIISVH